MLIGFAGASGRTEASHVALLVARTLVALEGAVTLIVPGDAVPGTADARLDVVPLPPGDQDAMSVVLESLTPIAGDRRVVADLPPGVLVRPAVRAALDAAVLVVGPHDRDERWAAAFGTACDGGPRPWYLACGRAGWEVAAARFTSTMAGLDPGGRSLPVAMPPMGRGEATALDRADPSGPPPRLGTRLVAAIRETLPPTGHRPGGDRGEADAASHARSFPERLRDLADDVEAIEGGLAPTAADLAGAPVLDDWITDVVASPILKGTASGHPGILDGSRVRTSEVFATDRVTWARTLSRWYVLRTPSGAPALQ